ncbi:hypothetical protein ACVW1A_007177 [Bradyrhizobium sp. LB1.3]
MKITAAMFALLALTGSAPAEETVIYPQLPRDRQCAAIVDHGGGNVTVLIRCKGYIDWVIYSGADRE